MNFCISSGRDQTCRQRLDTYVSRGRQLDTSAQVLQLLFHLFKEETTMPKFYVACGSQTLVISTESAQQAALRLIDEVMAAHIWIYEDAGLSEQNRRDHLVLEALLHLGSAIAVSQRGLGRDDAGVFGVPDMLDEWHRLMLSIQRLMVSAGLNSLRVLPESSDAQDAPKLPR